MGCLNADQGFSHYFANIHFSGPCNCQIMNHSENIRKSHSKTINSNSQTIEQLILKIKKYTDKWKEQETVLKKIKEYEEGKRWKRY